MRIESRLGDGAMNIHLGTAAVLQAARLAVAGGYPAVPALEGDGFEDGGEGAERSATSLAGALADLVADTDFAAAVGQTLVDNFVANKGHEAERFEATGQTIDSDELSEFELDMYLPYH